MPSSFAHIAAGLGFGTPSLPGHVPSRYWWCAAFCAAIPDIDWLWSGGALPWDHWLAHRGLTHSLVFAACLAGLVTWLCLRSVAPPGTLGRLWGGLALATASHGFFDALSTYGLGVAFFAPFTSHRFFFPWRPITGAGVPRPRSLALKVLPILGREVLWVWVPAGIVAVLAWWWRRRSSVR